MFTSSPNTPLERRSFQDRRRRPAEPYPARVESEAGKSYCHFFVQNIDNYAVIFFNELGKIISWNPAAEKIFGYSQDEVLGQNGDLIFTAEDRALGVPAKEMTAAKNAGRAVDDRWHARKNGSRFWANGDMMALRDDDKHLLGFVKVIQDRTDLRQALDAMHKTQDRLTRSNLELERFASIVSHDLQSPLYKIESLSRTLESEQGRRLGFEGLQAVVDIRATAARMAEMIKSILNYSRIETMELEKAAVSLDLILKNVLADLAQQLTDKQAEVVHGPLPDVIGDDVLLYQLFLNLVSNALKFTRRSPVRIEIMGRMTPEGCHITVKDNGIGIPEKDHQRIFEFLQRGQGNGAPGVGIGLAVCKRIVQRHGGRIWVESELGHGSAFHFIIPPATP